jgi:hypothetical protein
MSGIPQRLRRLAVELHQGAPERGPFALHTVEDGQDPGMPMAAGTDVFALARSASRSTASTTSVSCSTADL